MPWKLVHNHPACRAGEWAVVNERAEAEGRHSIEGCHATRDEALAQQRALYANEPSASAAGTHEVEQMEPRRLFTRIEQKAITDVGNGEITGLAAVYGNVDLQDDQLEPGSLAKTAADWSRSKSKIALLDWHGSSLDRIIGSVTELKSITQGLWFRSGFTNDEQGQRARKLVKDGHLSGVSIGWLPVHESMKMIGGRMVRAVSEARLLEISLTPVPANPLAQVASVKSLDGEAKAISDTPWSQFTQADYSPEQWARACLIDTGQGDPGSKDRYKLPVREPSGTLNRNGVHAAAGGHGLGQVQGISSEQRATAARALIRLYGQLGEDPPDSLRRMAGQSTSSSLDYESFAGAMSKALAIEFEPARKAAVDQLVTAYHDSTAAGPTQEGPESTADPAAATTPSQVPAGTATPPSLLTPREYVDSVLQRVEQADGSPASLDELEAKIRASLGGA